MRIAIIGAGPAGLTLSLALQQLAPRIEVEMFEADPGFEARTQGWAVALRTAGGLGVLDRLGVSVAACSRPENRHRITDPEGRTLLETPACLAGPTLRTDRERLREVLRDAQPDVAIRFDRKAVEWSPAPSEDAPATVRFEDGSQAEADLVVACDGAGSALRKSLHGKDECAFQGLLSITGSARLEVPEIDDTLLRVLAPDGSSTQAYPEDGGAVVSVTWPAADLPEGFEEAAPDALRRRLATVTEGHGEFVAGLVAGLQTDTLKAQPGLDLLTHRPLLDRGRLLIGDAAHPMLPSRGQGANVALRDAEDLARHLAGDEGANPEALAVLARRLARRGRAEVRRSRDAARDHAETRPLAQARRNLVYRLAGVALSLRRG